MACSTASCRVSAVRCGGCVPLLVGLVAFFAGFEGDFAVAADPAFVRLTWRQLPALPDAEGFAGMFAGTCGDRLCLAGGANFVGKRPWEGGVKRWYDDVWLLDPPGDKQTTAGTWRRVGRLPRPTAYGIAVSTPEGVICAGGGDGEQHYRDVYLLAWRDGRLVREDLPPLPQPCSFASGALVGSTFYISGGIDQPQATRCLHTLWALDLNRMRSPGARWESLEPCPGVERDLAVAGADEDSFCLFSGQRLSPDPPNRPAREFLRDAWRFRPTSGWQRLADLPRSATGAPSPAPRLADGRLLVFTGDDGTKITFKPEEQHPGFPRDVLAYDPTRNTWETIGSVPFSRATVPTTRWRGSFIIPNGEVRPGYRTPEVWALEVK